MTINELIERLQNIVKNEPEAGECNIYNPIDYDKAFRLDSKALTFGISSSEPNSETTHILEAFTTYKATENYLKQGLENGEFEEEFPNHIVLELGYYE